MKKIQFLISLFIILLSAGSGFSQSFETPVVAFNQAANEYIYQGTGRAVQTLNTALRQFPEDEKLKALLEKILKDKQQEEKNEQNKEQEQNEQENQEKENQEQKSKEQQNEEQQQEQEQSEEEKDAEEKKNAENAQPQQAEKNEDEQKEADESEIRQNLEEMKISPEKAQMILDALKNNEIQYIQQMQRRPTQRPDSNKPDW